jgi:hypothetical protein
MRHVKILIRNKWVNKVLIFAAMQSTVKKMEPFYDNPARMRRMVFYLCLAIGFGLAVEC